MVQFTTTIHKFEKQGEKTGWTYVEIPADIAGQLVPVGTGFEERKKILLKQILMLMDGGLTSY